MRIYIWIWILQFQIALYYIEYLPLHYLENKRIARAFVISSLYVCCLYPQLSSELESYDSVEASDSLPAIIWRRSTRFAMSSSQSLVKAALASTFEFELVPMVGGPSQSSILMSALRQSKSQWFVKSFLSTKCRIKNATLEFSPASGPRDYNAVWFHIVW